jgi:hypothetical protein
VRNIPYYRNIFGHNLAAARLSADCPSGVIGAFPYCRHQLVDQTLFEH